MITLLYRPLRPPKIHLAGRSNFDSAHYSNLSISSHPPTMLLHHFGFQDLFFFPGHPRGWAGLPCWQGEGSIVQFLIQVVKSYRYGSMINWNEISIYSQVLKYPIPIYALGLCGSTQIVQKVDCVVIQGYPDQL